MAVAVIFIRVTLAAAYSAADAASRPTATAAAATSFSLL